MPPPPREKDIYDTMIDFFFGAVGGLLLTLYISARLRLVHIHLTELGWFLYLMGGALVGGGVTGLFRERMSEPTLLSNLPHDPSKQSKVVLWIVTAVGAFFLALAFLVFPQT